MENGNDLKTAGRSNLKAEFDLLADEYRTVHEKNIAITGEGPEYFAEYKIADLLSSIESLKRPSASIVDFGCGIGNSVPFFRTYFPSSKLTCADVSSRSIEIARERFPGNEAYALIDDMIPLPDESQDITFSACVFHHIPHEQHVHWLSELLRITRPGGILAIYEHNPLNPLTVKAVNTCPLDVNAKLIRAGIMRQRALEGGWDIANVRYTLFFPAALASLRSMEKHLSWCAFGAQYQMLAQKANR